MNSNLSNNPAKRCIRCLLTLEKGFRCGVCDSYFLCSDCWKSVGHFHKLIQFDLEVADQESLNDEAYFTVETLNHSIKCLKFTCEPSCRKMKDYIIHMVNCEQSLTDHCQVCLRYLSLAKVHIRACKEKYGTCRVPYCFYSYQKSKDELMRDLQESRADRAIARKQQSQNSEKLPIQKLAMNDEPLSPAEMLPNKKKKLELQSNKKAELQTETSGGLLSELKLQEEDTSTTSTGPVQKDAHKYNPEEERSLEKGIQCVPKNIDDEMKD